MLLVTRIVAAAACAAALLAAGCGDSTGPGPAPTLAVRPDSVLLATPGDTLRLLAEGAAVTWSSSDTTVAAVSSAGVVRAVGFGRATVAASAGAVRREIPVTVGERGVERWASSREASATGDNLRSVWAFGGADVLVGGNYGAMLRYDGSRWTRMETGTQAHLNGMWAASARDVFAVGYGAERSIVRFDGARWSAMDPGFSTGAGLLAVWGSSADDVFAVGYDGLILRYDGTRWARMESGTTADLFGVWAASPTRAWAVGRDGTLLRYDGARWSAVAVSVPSDNLGYPALLSGVWGSSASDVYVSGDGVLLHWDGSRWTRIAVPADSYGRVWGSSARDVYVVGRAVLRFDGERWSTVGLPAGAPVYADAIGGTAGSVYLAGDDGTVVQGSGSAWRLLQYGPSLRDVWGAEGSVFAVGGSGALLHHGGSSWTAQNAPVHMEFYAVGGRSRSRMYALGQHGLRYDGARWDSVAAGGEALWVDPAGRAYVVRNTLTAPFRNIPPSYRRWIEVRDGGTARVVWEESGTGSLRSLTAIWGRSAGDVYAVGSDGRIVHFDGAAWTARESGTTARLRAVGGGAAGAVFAAGDGGVVLRWDGRTWTRQGSGTTANLLDLWASSEGNAYAVGERGTLLRYDGRRWSAMDAGTTLALRGVWGAGPAEVYAVGDQGLVLKGTR